MPGAGNDPLTIRLYQGSTLLQTRTISAAEIKDTALFQGATGNANSGSNKDRRWHTVALSPPINFVTGIQYSLELRSTSATPYFIYAPQLGTWADVNGDGCIDGLAQFTTNSGSTWSTWVHYSGSGSLCRMSVAFMTT
jgi:hypothetical protein